MKACDYEEDLILGRLPGLSVSCNVRESVASFVYIDQLVRSFPFVWLLLSIFCLYVWMSLVSFLAKFMGMDDRLKTSNRSFTRSDRVGKSRRSPRKTPGRHAKAKKMQEKVENQSPATPLTSPIVTMIVSHEQRVFVAHEEILCRSPLFRSLLKDEFVGDSKNKVVALPDEEPEVLSCVLEFLYKGDYFPRLLRNKDTNSMELENSQNVTTHPGGRGSSEATMFHSAVGDVVLRDTVVYCAAEKYGLEGLKSLAIRKQGLQSGIPIDVILRSARYAYDNTPDSEYRLRAHYLAMIIRTRQIFKTSGTMQFEMEMGHKFYFDLFVAMCNHMDDLEEISNDESPKMT
ncbi:hypothetical protein ANOM_007254 [Aspergillus nomiae NRRL 13137]|uniref:BTB domain-containing protein n=1 Tax=Aspergillus nomiae NRRL (strain ATCC 15546 / NRRL 13137 / CBS 260.88 / M93) TaxID=1509407 RepID=A0A0L1IYR6_ASPN3|nr:uncharacterized protein ANOM_007254 [Aspergillus nomiae NRRL 13137]KNG84313.1 hypothetical protein ANOM_007254 [Aspergillus nomiae NRRL 13137]